MRSTIIIILSDTSTVKQWEHNLIKIILKKSRVSYDNPQIWINHVHLVENLYNFHHFSSTSYTHPFINHIYSIWWFYFHPVPRAIQWLYSFHPKQFQFHSRNWCCVVWSWDNSVKKSFLLLHNFPAYFSASASPSSLGNN